MPRRVDDELVTAVGSRIRSRRDALGLTQEELAARAGIHSETLSRVERGRMQPTLTLLLALAEALGATTSVLLGEVPGDLSSAEEEVLRLFRERSPTSQGLVRDLLRQLR